MCRKFEVNTFNNSGVITFCNFLSHNTRGYSTIREYGSTLYVGMAPKKNGRPYNSIATNELKSLLIYTDMFKYTHTF